MQSFPLNICFFRNIVAYAAAACVRAAFRGRDVRALCAVSTRVMRDVVGAVVLYGAVLAAGCDAFMAAVPNCVVLYGESEVGQQLGYHAVFRCRYIFGADGGAAELPRTIEQRVHHACLHPSAEHAAGHEQRFEKQYAAMLVPCYDNADKTAVSVLIREREAERQGVGVSSERGYLLRCVADGAQIELVRALRELRYTATVQLGYTLNVQTHVE